MPKARNMILKKSLRWHNWFGWVGGIALLIFALSGMTHPLMSWTGPKAASFFPPQAKMNVSDAVIIPRILARHSISNALMVKIVPSNKHSVLQVTQSNDEPRRYFDLTTYEELLGYDKEQAQWLARYYTGLKESPIKNITFQTEFDAAYPWVNRLLPVYKVEFDTDDNRVAFIYTELGVLANLTNDWKTSVQSIFRALHTWTWLNEFKHARVVLIGLLMISLFAMAATGTAMVFLMKNRKMGLRRKLHRLISYAIWIPLLMFSISGFYHLLQYAYGDNHRGLQLGGSVMISQDRFSNSTDAIEQYFDLRLNAITVVEGPEGNLLYRLSIPKGKHGQAIERTQKYDGMAIEKPAIYFDTLTGKQSSVTDREMAVYHAGKILGLDPELIKNTGLITHFGPHYDFRNKRLPVWKIDYDTELGDKLFIDPATGTLVDRLVNMERYEGYSFSFLHKWNFVTPLIGRQNRDILMVVLLSLAVVATVFGYMMLLKTSKKTKKVMNPELRQTSV